MRAEATQHVTLAFSFIYPFPKHQYTFIFFNCFARPCCPFTYQTLAMQSLDVIRETVTVSQRLSSVRRPCTATAKRAISHPATSHQRCSVTDCYGKREAVGMHFFPLGKDLVCSPNHSVKPSRAIVRPACRPSHPPLLVSPCRC